MRRYSYDTYSEGQAAHWLLLVLGDRIDSTTAHVKSLVSLRPDDPITQSGILGERGHKPISSRFGRGRADLKHMWLDPIIVVGPWLLAGTLVFALGRAVVRPARRRHPERA